MGLIHPVMQQLSSAMQQLKRRDMKNPEIVSADGWLIGGKAYRNMSYKQFSLKRKAIIRNIYIYIYFVVEKD